MYGVINSVCRFSPSPSIHKNPCSPDNPFGKLVTHNSEVAVGLRERRRGSVVNDDLKKQLTHIKKRELTLRQSFSILPGYIFLSYLFYTLVL